MVASIYYSQYKSLNCSKLLTNDLTVLLVLYLCTNWIPDYNHRAYTEPLSCTQKSVHVDGCLLNHVINMIQTLQSIGYIIVSIIYIISYCSCGIFMYVVLYIYITVIVVVSLCMVSYRYITVIVVLSLCMVSYRYITVIVVLSLCMLSYIYISLL